MSGTFPSSPAPRRFYISSVQPTRVSVAQSLRRNSRTTNAQRWLIKLEFASGERSDLDPISAFIESQRGRYDTFTYVLPNPLHTPRGAGAVGSPSPYVDGTQVSPTLDTQSGRSIITRWQSLSTLVLRAGDFLKFASHSKVYRITQDITTSATGVATLVMNPAAIQSLSHGDAIQTSSVPFTVCLGSDDSGFTIQPGPIFSIDEVELLEVA